MSTLAQRLSDLATRIATECKSLRTLVNGNAADLSALITTKKTNLVEALNEVKAQANSLAASGGATINDSAASSASQTYSIDKIKFEIAATAATTQQAILGGASAAYDTLKELQDLLVSEDSQITDILTALGNRVRIDAAQTLTTAQKAQARSNIDAYGSTELGNPDADLVTVFTTGLS